MAYILGNWQVNGILTLMSGTPINFTSTAALNAPGNTDTPNVKGDFRVLGGINNDAPWFDPTVFLVPATNSFGSAGRNPARVRISIISMHRSSRTFRLKSGTKLEFRVEAFSLPNAPSSAVERPEHKCNDTPNFGYIGGAGGSRSIQMCAKLAF